MKTKAFCMFVAGVLIWVAFAPTLGLRFLPTFLLFFVTLGVVLFTTGLCILIWLNSVDVKAEKQSFLAHCLHCHWEGPISDLKRHRMQGSIFLHCPNCDADEFEFEVKS